MMSKAERYRDAAREIAAVIDGEPSRTARLASAACLLSLAFPGVCAYRLRAVFAGLARPKRKQLLLQMCMLFRGISRVIVKQIQK